MNNSTMTLQNVPGFDGRNIGISNGTLVFSGNQSITGSNTISFLTSNFSTNVLRSVTGTLTIGTSNLIQTAGGSGAVGATGVYTVNRGTLEAQSSKKLSTAGTFTNLGTMRTDGATLQLDGNWTNLGTIEANNGTVSLGGTFSFASIGTLTQTGTSTINLDGLLNNTNQTFQLDNTTGTWNLRGGIIFGGTVTTAGSARASRSLARQWNAGWCHPQHRSVRYQRGAHRQKQPAIVESHDHACFYVRHQHLFHRFCRHTIRGRDHRRHRHIHF